MSDDRDTSLEDLFEQMEQDMPLPDRLVSQAHRAQMGGDHQKAVTLFIEAMNSGRDEPGVLLDLAKALIALDRHQEAVEQLKLALYKEKDPIQARSINLAMSRAYEAMGDEANAREQYRIFQSALDNADKGE